MQTTKGWFEAAYLAWKFNPIVFAYTTENPHFKIKMQFTDDGTPTGGYVLASAFFPDAVTNVFVYPILYEQPESEIINTLCHEIGHIFDLRHYFAQSKEKDWPSVLFGKQNKETIMNYGDDSKLMPNDIEDLKDLYGKVWGGQSQINNHPVKLIHL